MPKLPQYESQAQLTTRQPSVLAPKSTEGEATQAVGQAAAQAAEATLRWSKAVDSIQATVAETNFKTGMLDIAQRATNDTDINSEKKYQQEIQKLRANSLKGVTNPDNAARVGLDLDYMSKAGSIGIQNTFKKKTIAQGQVATQKLIQLEVDNPSEDSAVVIEDILNEKVQEGILGEVEANNILIRAKKQIKQNMFVSDLVANPKLTKERLTKNFYGFDVKELNNAHDVYDREVKQMQAKNLNQLVLDYLNDEDINTDEIKQMANDLKIDPKGAEQVIKRIENPRPSRRSQDIEYVRYQRRVADLQQKGDKATIEEITKLMSDTMHSHTEGKLDESDVERILKEQSLILDEKINIRAEQMLRKADPRKWYDIGKYFTDEYADSRPDVEARINRKLLDGLERGENGDVLIDQILDEEMDVLLSMQLEKTPSDMVRMITPEGVAIDVPKENVKKAEERGAKIANR